MSILYLMTAPTPPIEGTDAVFQEVAALRQIFPGVVINLAPLRTSRHRFPKQLLGFHKIQEIRRLEQRCAVNHIFFGSAYPFPVLRLLRNPVIYTVTGSLDVNKRPLTWRRLRQLNYIVVSNQRDATILDAWGLKNYEIIAPGVDTSALTSMTLPLNRELTLLMASAPWNIRQFGSKGINLLLAAAAQLPFLRLLLLWRGVLADEITRRVRRFKLMERVEIINRRVNVAEYLQRAHAAVLLCNDGGLVKAYPHSLIEALVAAKPVLVTNTIAMAEFVNQQKCGVVIPEMNIRDLTSGLEMLISRYDEFCRNAGNIERDMFSVDKMINNYRRLYEM